MIGWFIGGFVTGAVFCFVTLFIMAVCRLKSQQRKLMEGFQCISKE